MCERADLRKIVAEAHSEARSLGASRIEAEHLLLALAAHPQTCWTATQPGGPRPRDIAPSSLPGV